MSGAARASGAPIRSDGPRVLAIADVAVSYVAAWRVHGPLAALKRLGLVADFAVTDAALRGLPSRGRFDVVWLQRAVDPFVIARNQVSPLRRAKAATCRISETGRTTVSSQ